MDNIKLKNTTAQGMFYRTLESVGTQVMNFFIQLVLARILFPEDFGIVATLNIFINIANTFINNGISSGLLRKKDAKDVDFCTVFYLEVGIAVCMYLGIFFLAPVIADFYNNPDFILYLRVFALTLVISALGSFQTTVLRYRMDFRTSFYANLFGLLAQGFLGIILALMGFGVWSIILSQLAYRGVSSLLLMIFTHWVPKLQFSFRSFLELFSFSWKMFVGWLIGTLYMDAFSLIIGKVYDEKMLGYYSKGQSIPAVVNKTVTQVTAAVLFPVIAKVQDDKIKVKNQTRSMLAMSSALVFPVMAGIAAVAQPFVLVVLTDKWALAIPIIQILTISMAMNVINNANMQTFNAIGRSDIFLIIETIKRAVTVILVIIVAKIDFYLLLWVIAGMGIVSLTINACFNKRLLNYAFKEQIKDILPYLLYGLGLFAIVYPINYLTISEFLKLILQVGLCGLIYICSICLIKKGAFAAIKKSLTSLLNTRKEKNNAQNVTLANGGVNMKKLLLLGGSAQQVIAIEKAKELGYYTVLCDYLEDNPGQYVADKFYLISTTDKEAVLKVAKSEQIDGVLAYASDPAAPTAAYVAEALGLPGNPYESVCILCEKDRFRQFLSANGFCTPKARGYNAVEQAVLDLNEGVFTFPVIVKPVDSSGSKGVGRVDCIDEAKDKLQYAMEFSRQKRIIIEEYVEKFGYQIAGDGLSIDGKLVFRCFANDHFNPNCENPFVPISASFPYNMPEWVQEKVHNEIQRLITLLSMKTCTYNFDMRIDKDYNVYLMEVAPRDGGNYIPQLIKYATGVDLVECSIKAALGENIKITATQPQGYWSYFAVHSLKNGILSNIHIDETFAKNHIVENHIVKRNGDEIKSFTGANTTLGCLLLKFNSMEEMLWAMDNSEEWIQVIVE